MFSFKKQKKFSYDETLLSASTPFAFTEAYKMLRTNLNFVSMSGKFKKLLVTSSIPNEGKSTVAINLAITLAETGCNVLLIDCDMRNPSIHRYLRMRNIPRSGLSSILAGDTNIENSILEFRKGEKRIFDFIPVGSIPPNPAELIGSEAMKNLLDMLSSQYDYIICDTPPATVVSDSAILSRYCDGVLLVIKQKFSTKQQVLSAKQGLETVGATILGTILNQYNIEDDRKKNSNRYGYGVYNYSYGYDSTQKSNAKRTLSSNHARIRQ